MFLVVISSCTQIATSPSPPSFCIVSENILGTKWENKRPIFSKFNNEMIVEMKNGNAYQENVYIYSWKDLDLQQRTDFNA